MNTQQNQKLILAAINAAYPHNSQTTYSAHSPALTETASSQTSIIDSAEFSAKVIQTPPQWLTIKQLSLAEPAFSEASLRNLIFKSKDRKSSRGIIAGNGLANSVRRIGSKVIISHQGFLSWLTQQGSN